MAPPDIIGLSSLDGTNGFILRGAALGDQSGYSVASAGDINGDGFADLIVGAWGADNTSGASYVVFGKASGFGTGIDLSSLDGTTGFRLSGGAAYDNNGWSVASAGDVNGDGFADLIVGAPSADPHASNSGASYVVFGKASGFGSNLDLSALDDTMGFKLSGVAALDRSGTSVASAGDVNGDGFDDLIIGADLADPHGSASGASYVVFGKASGFGSNIDLSALDGTTGFRLSGAAENDTSGRSAASAGDVNGDGYDDLIVGAVGAGPHGIGSGASYVVFGKASGFGSNLDLSTLDGSNGFRLSGANAGDNSGCSVASAGDVNGDGYDDLIVGAGGARPHGIVSGASYVVFGKASGFGSNLDLSTLDGSTGFKLNGTAAYDFSGSSVASAGDVNGDGFDDLIVGAPQSIGSGAGVSYVVFGKASGFAAVLDLSTLDGTTGFRLDGATAGDLTGSSVAAAGDVNGDGYDDLIVGAPAADAGGGFLSGASYVVFGGAFGSSDTPVTTAGTAAAEILIGGNGDDVLTGGGGQDVFHAGAGDDRLIVADLDFRLADGGNGSDTLALDGAGLTLDVTVVATAAKLEGIERIDLTGTGDNTLTVDAFAVLDGIGAVTGGVHVLAVDGYAGDLVSLRDVGWEKTGSFTDANGTFDSYVLGNAEVDVEQGVSVVRQGAIELSSLDGTNGFSLRGEVHGEQSGCSVASAGDINGDGFADVIVGARNADAPDLYSGASYVVFGRASGFDAATDLSSLDGSTGFTLSGAVAYDRSGWSVASAGDVNGDGFDDLIVGVPFGYTDGRYCGESYVVFGKASGFGTGVDLSSLDGTTGFRLSGVDLGDFSGFAVASAGDVNGDGYDDLIVGSPLANANGDRSGASYVVFGKASGFTANLDLSALEGSNGFRLRGATAFDYSGTSVASAGDVNGDGFADLIVGANVADPNGTNSGASYVVFGKASGFGSNLDLSTLDGSNGFRLSGEAAYDNSGFSVASAGDVNGDGFDDLIVGARGAAPHGSYSGASYVVFGRASGFGSNLDLSTLDGTTGFKLSGASALNFSGFSVASAGDINGDGFDDVIVGAPGADPNGYASGASYVVFGKASGFAANIDLSSLDGSTGFRLDGVTVLDSSGQSVAAAGDVNGDGFDDLIVGASYGDVGGGVRAGVSYVVFGGAFGPADAPVTTVGTAAAEILIGGNADDVLTGGGGQDVFHAGAGDDRLIAADLSFRLADGGNGSDTLALGGAGLSLDLTSVATAVKLEGIERIDLTGTGNNTLKVDKFAVLGGIGATTGGKHVLTVEADSGDVVAFGGEAWVKTGSFTNADGTFDRWVLGNAEVDVDQDAATPGVTIEGTAGNDRIGASSTVSGQPFPTSRNDIINGNGGNDIIDGLAGADTMNGGAGNDTFYVDDGADQVLEAANGGTDTVYSKVGYTLASGQEIEILRARPGTSAGLALTGNAFKNSILGGSGADVLDGGGEDDKLYGNDGADTLTGGAGDDYLQGGAGIDTMSGGTGDDTYVVDNAADRVLEAANEGTDRVYAQVAYTLASGQEIEILQAYPGTTAGLALTGNELRNSILGGTGADMLDGGGDDDKLYGNDGADTLTGGAGDDYLQGGAGIDRMSGGIGSDTYVVDNSADQVLEAANEGVDTVYARVAYTLASGQEIEILRAWPGTTAGLALTGNELANTLIGGDGNDVLDGRLGADTMTGDAGNDRYYVDNAADQAIEGIGGGTDTVYAGVSYTLKAGREIEFLRANAGATGLTLVGNELDNLIYGGSGADVLTGGKGRDELYGNDGADTLNGGDGDDYLQGGAGIDTMSGATGNDTYVVDNAADQVLEAAKGGTDTVYARTDYTLAAGQSIEILRAWPGTTGSLALAGNAFGNSILGGAGADELDGGDGDDKLFGNDGADSLTGGAGNDSLDGGVGVDTMSGGTGNDTYIVDSSADQVLEAANEGTDAIHAKVSYTLASGQSVEILRVSSATVAGLALTGNELANSILGGAGADELDGGGGDDKLIGGNGADTLTGGAGNDSLDGGDGADTMSGGIGDDIYIVDNAADEVIEAANEGTDTVYARVSYTLAAGQEIEVLRAFAGSTGLVLTGNALDNTLVGGSGNDVLDGGAGDDKLIGNDGNDTITTEGQYAVIQGGAGDDTIRLDGTSTSGGTADGGGGNDIVRSADLGQFVITNVETLDTYYGFTNASVAQIASFDSYTADLGAADTQIAFSLRGAGGTLDFTTGIGGQNSVEIRDAGLTSAISITGSVNGDLMFGSTFGDTLKGGNGADTLYGNADADTLSGGAGNDVLNGGLGNDTLTGGSGNDIFAFDTPFGAGDNIDLVADFTFGSDKIQLDNTYYFAGLTAGQLAAAQFSATGGATSAGPQIVYDRSTGALSYDSNGAGAGGSTQFATIAGHPTLTAADFLVVHQT